MVFTSDLASTLKENLEGLLLDKHSKSKRVFPQWCEETAMKDAYEDILDIVGPGLLTQKTEGAEMGTGAITEDVLTRHRAKTYARKILITKEAEEDCKYEEALQAGKMLLNAAYKTQDYLCTQMLTRGFDTNYPTAFGVPVWSASQPLNSGATFSNLLATPMSPSRLAVTTARTMAMQMVDRDGTIGSYDLESVVFPVGQWDAWDVVCGSDKAPEAGEFNAINVVKKMGLKKVANRFWQNTTTNYFFTTDAEGGFSYRERRKMTSRTWVDNDNEVMKYSVSFRMAAGLPSNPRSTIGVNA